MAGSRGIPVFVVRGGREKRKEKKGKEKKKKTAHTLWTFCTPDAPLEILISTPLLSSQLFSPPSIAHLDIFLLFSSTPRILKDTPKLYLAPGFSSPDPPEWRTFRLLPTSNQVWLVLASPTLPAWQSEGEKKRKTWIPIRQNQNNKPVINQRHHRRKRSQPANIRSSKISSHRLQVQVILKEGEEEKNLFSVDQWIFDNNLPIIFVLSRIIPDQTIRSGATKVFG